MFIKVKRVEPLQDLILRITFESGVVKLYDVKPLAERMDDFKVLYNNNLFRNVKPDLGGYGISWNNFTDIECTELWENGIAE